MAIALKPLDRQVVVVTGASSGIGLATARAAAAAGARVMLAARDGAALARIRDEIAAEGGVADHLATDVGDAEQVEALALATIDRFGGFDTWVNDAGVGVFATLDRLDPEDHHALFRTNYFGVVHGSLAAVRHFRAAGKPGALINVGSALSDVATPLQVAYAATKHAVKGLTDGLRIELMQEGLPVSVTLIKPSAIDTPFFDHAKSAYGGMGRAPGPHYAPELVAAAILYAACHPKRDFPVGAAAAFAPFLDRVAPGLLDRKQAAQRLEDLVDFGRRPEADALSEVPHEGRTRSRAQRGRAVSLTTAAQLRPRLSAGLAAGGLALLGVLAGRLLTRARPTAGPVRGGGSRVFR